MFDVLRLLIVVIVTILAFNKYICNGDSFSKIFFALIVFPLFLYCGLGAALNDCLVVYIYHYLIYILFIVLGIRFSIGKYSLLESSSVANFVSNYGGKIIFLYIFFACVGLVYPENRLANLLHPPAPNLLDVFAQRFEEQDPFSTLITFVRNFITPFFYLSLYSYRGKLLKMGFLLLFLMYISYCSTGYIGRGSILINILLFVLLVYFWRPQLRRKLLFVTAIGVPFLLIFFVNYVSIRLGGEAESISFIEAVEALLFSESSYPLWFDVIYNREYDFQDAIDYLYWLLTLPSPISLNFAGYDFSLNYKISELILGISRGEEHFYVLLPGMVGEAFFIFKYFFWLHAFFYGIIIGWVYSCIRSKDICLPLGIYLAIMLGYYCARGGTTGAYPFVLKQFLYMAFILKCYQWYPLKFVLKLKS